MKMLSFPRVCFEPARRQVEKSTIVDVHFNYGGRIGPVHGRAESLLVTDAFPNGAEV